MEEGERREGGRMESTRGGGGKVERERMEEVRSEVPPPPPPPPRQPGVSYPKLSTAQLSAQCELRLVNLPLLI